MPRAVGVKTLRQVRLARSARQDLPSGDPAWSVEVAVREVMVNVKVLSVRVGAPAWREARRSALPERKHAEQAHSCPKRFFHQSNGARPLQSRISLSPRTQCLTNSMSWGTKWAPFGLSDGAVGDRKGTD